MKIGFVDRDKMRLEFQEDGEREVLHQLLVDAGRGGDPVILDQFETEAQRDDWEEFVRPELEERFRGQIDKVVEDLKEDKEVLEVAREHFDLWYGALNQARIALERRYHFAGVDAVDTVLAWENEKQSAFMRFQLALAIQSSLLEAMEWGLPGGEEDDGSD